MREALLDWLAIMWMWLWFAIVWVLLWFAIGMLLGVLLF